MAATLTRERFQTPDWVFERKFDGIRVLAFKQGAEVRLFSRNRLLQNEAYPSFVAAVAKLPVDELILDGEAMGWFGTSADASGYLVFDVLWIEGRDLRGLPLDSRREILERLPIEEPLRVVERLEGEEPWKRACELGWEGVIAKRRESRYESRRSPHWLKMKCEASQELVIGGFTDPQGQRVGLGALLLGYFDESDFVFAGKVGTGFDTKLLVELRAKLSALETSSSPFTRAEGLPRSGAHWVKPEVVVQVAFMEWTSHGKLRHPRLVGVRIDKAAHEVKREAT